MHQRGKIFRRNNNKEYLQAPLGAKYTWFRTPLYLQPLQPLSQKTRLCLKKPNGLHHPINPILNGSRYNSNTMLIFALKIVIFGMFLLNYFN